MDEDEQGSIEDKVNKGTAKQVGGEKKVDKKNLVKAFVNIIKAGFLHREADEADVEVYKNALTSDTTAGSEGEVGIGVTIPEDIRTDIIELRRSSDNLEQYVNVEGVVTKTGTRNIVRLYWSKFGISSVISCMVTSNINSRISMSSS